MAKEMKKVEFQPTTVWKAKIVCCQTCKHHSNKPSFCKKNGFPVARKTKLPGYIECHEPAW